jgi:glutathione S-transferase
MGEARPVTLYQNKYRAKLDAELATRDYVASAEFSIADITLLCVIDFVVDPARVPND